MSSNESGILLFNLLDILGVLVLVAANGFFVAAEFSLVAVRRSRVAALAAAGRANAAALQRAVNNLDANLAATQLGITIASLALGWIGEPALAYLVEPVLDEVPVLLKTVGAHAIAVAIAFVIITALQIVLGELAPKSLALQRSESTALWVVRPLQLFLFLFRPAISALNGLGNLVLRGVGLRHGAAEESLHSPEELKLLVQASQDAGILQDVQEEVMVRVLNIGERRVSSIMPRPEINWIDADESQDEMLRTIRACRQKQVLVGRGSIDQPLGMVLKTDLLDQVLDDHALDPLAVIREPLIVPEAMPILAALGRFRQTPARLAIVLNEYGTLEGVVTRTDLLAAIAGDLPDAEGEEPNIVEREDGSLMIDGLTPVEDAFDRRGVMLDHSIADHPG